jgi:hypothetical protein
VQAASQAGSIASAKVPPPLGSLRSTSRFVRFEPGRRSEAAFAMNTEPYRNGRSLNPRLRAACTSTGVRKTTAVSRLRTAVTAATSARSAVNRARAPRRVRASRTPTASKRPSAAATAPIRSMPATSTNGLHAGAAEARIVSTSTLNS